MTKTDYFIEENRKPNCRSEHTSPSGRYKLVVDSYSTKKGSWSYTRGRLFTQDSDEPVGDVMRNYSAFPFAWAENHDDGHDYIICGKDYQGQTVIQLDTGERRDNLSEGAEKGHGFCWATHQLLEDGKTLMVEGCHWACPYEYRFYDFSNPMSGWPELDFPEEVGGLDNGRNTRTTFEDGLVVWKQVDRVFKETGEREHAIDRQESQLMREVHKAKHQKQPEDVIAKAEAELSAYQERYGMDLDEDDHLWGHVDDHILKLRVEDSKLVLANEWKSDHKVEQDRLQEKYQEESLQQRRGWMEADALLQLLKSEVGDIKTGFMYPSLVNRWEGEPNPAFFQVPATKDYDKNHQATLQWGVQEGEVTVDLWVRGKGSVDKPVFPRTPEGIRAAWETGQTHLSQVEAS